MTLPIGARVGPYEVLGALGAGGMGEVYKARDSRLEREVALKVMPASFAADPDRVRRFETEARAVAALSHPNIVAIFDVGSWNGSPYLVTELLEGATLNGVQAHSQGGGVRGSDGVRSGGGARQRDRAPGSQAGQRISDHDRADQDSGFRAGEATAASRGVAGCDSDGGYKSRGGGRHRTLYESGAGARTHGGCPFRHFQLRIGALRTAHRKARLCG